MDVNDDAKFKKPDNSVASRCQLVVFSPDIFNDFISSVTAKNTLIESSSTDNKRTSKTDKHSSLCKTNLSSRKRIRKPANKRKPTAEKKCQKQNKKSFFDKSIKSEEDEKSSKENLIINEGGMSECPMLKEALSSKIENADFYKIGNQKNNHESESVEPSMLQTSALLKESVLLSPSFVDSITMNVNEYRTNKEGKRCIDLCESPIVNPSEDIKSVTIPIYNSENIGITTEYHLHDASEDMKTDKSVIKFSHTTENLKYTDVIINTCEPPLLANTTNNVFDNKNTDLTQNYQIMCSTPEFNIVHVNDNVNEKADDFNIECEKSDFSFTIKNNNPILTTKGHYKHEISILSNEIIKPEISNTYYNHNLVHINSTKSHVAGPKSCKETIGEISVKARVDQTIQAESLKSFRNYEIELETDKGHETNTFSNISITDKETDDNISVLPSNLYTHKYTSLSPTLNSNLLPPLHAEKSSKVRVIHENTDKICKKNTSECKFGSENFEHYENTEHLMKSLQDKHFLPDLGNSIHLESSSLSSNVSSLTDNEPILNSDEIFSPQEKTGLIQIKETSELTNSSGEGDNNVFHDKLSKELTKTPTQLEPVTLQKSRKTCDNMNMYFKTEETPNDDPENCSKPFYHAVFKTHDSNHISDYDTVNNGTICSLNISNETVLSDQIEDSVTYTGEIYSSPQKVSSVSSCNGKLHINRGESNESNIVSTLADYLNKALRRKTDYLRLQCSNKSLNDTSRYLKSPVNDINGVEKTDGNIKNRSTRDWKNVISYAPRKSTRMLMIKCRKNLSTSHVKLSDNTEQPLFENFNIDCDITSNNQTIDIPIFHFDSKYAFNSDLEDMDFTTINIPSSERISSSGHETMNKNSITSACKYSENRMESEYDITMSVGVIPTNEGENERLNESETIFSADENVELFQNILAKNSTELLVSTILNEGSLTSEDIHPSEDLIELADLKSNASDIIINTLFSSGEYSIDILEKIGEIDMFKDSQCNIGDSTVITPLNEIEIQNSIVDYTNKHIRKNLSNSTSDESNNLASKEIPVLHEKMCDDENNMQLNGLESKLEYCKKNDIGKTPQPHNLKSPQECNTNTITITKKRRGRPPKLKCLNLETKEELTRNNVITDSTTSSNTRLQSRNGPSNKDDVIDTGQERDSRMEGNNVIKTDQVQTNQRRASKRKSVIEEESNVNIHRINRDNKSPLANCTRTQSANLTVLASAVGHQYESTKDDLQLKDKESDTEHCKRKKTTSGPSKGIIDLLNFERTSSNSSTINMVDMVQCGICYKQVKSREWLHHCGKEHNYLAWINGQKPIDFSDNNAVIQHLRKISKPGFPLVCTVCLKTWNSPKRYWDHIRHCTAESQAEHARWQIVDSISHKEQIKKENNDTAVTNIVRCGICQWQGCDDGWWEHLFKEHEYLAWRDSEPRIDFNDEKIVQEHLKSILQKLSKLTCLRCGVERRYVRSFINHSKACAGIEKDNSTVMQNYEDENSLLVEIGSKPASFKDIPLGILKYESCIDPNNRVKCGVCQWEGLECDWFEHIFKEHDYLAWRDGEESLDLNNIQAVHNHLKCIMQKVSKLKCRRCGVERKYVKLYLDHRKRCESADPDTSQVSTQFEEDNNLTVSRVRNSSTCMADSSEHIRNEENNVDIMPINVKCALCQWQGAEGLWFDHIFKEHDYLAWRDGETPLDLHNEDAVLEHLKSIIHKLSKLVCRRCGIERKFVKSYMKHYKYCMGVPDTVIQDENNLTISTVQDDSACMEVSAAHIRNEENHVDIIPINVKCALCQWQGAEGLWFDHIFKEHDYLAWRDGETPLDLEDEDAVLEHLKPIIHKLSTLVCKRCGKERKYVKSYMKHYKNCTGIPDEVIQEVNDSTLVESNIACKRRRLSNDDEEDNISLMRLKETDKPVKCAVCQQEVDGFKWHDHLIGHNYMAWMEGESQLDETRQLKTMLLEYKMLTCRFCQTQLSSTGGYQHHIRRCEEKSQRLPGTPIAKRYVRKSDIVLPTSQCPTSDPVKCAVCFEEMPNKQWKSHLENVHYNLAWFEGGIPFDIMDHHTCYLILQDLLKKKKLVCVQCGMSRISAAGFYAHIIVCRKSEEEIDAMKVQCSVCERKYLPLAIAQHMLTHRTQDAVKSSPQPSEDADVPDTGGRRRAAVAAKANIEKITSVLVEDKKSCTHCNYVAYTAEELQKHATWCGRSSFKMEQGSAGDTGSDDDSGREGEWESESEESDSQVDSNLSAEESIATGSEASGGYKEYTEKRKDTTIERVPYKPGLDDSLFGNSFYKQFAEDFCRTHLTTSVLFPELKCNKFDPISSDVAALYMPPIARSCKIFKQQSQTDTIQWNQLDIFQSEMKYGSHTLFVGGPITAISFLPPANRLSCKSSEHYISVTCQVSANATGLASDQLYSHPGLVQIWSFGKFGKETAKFVLGIAHDYGTVWSLDWCPSGGWEPDTQSDQEATQPRRIGLMVVACSDGGAYIFAVCDPQQLPEREMPIYRTKPVMELELCSESYGRPRRQATAVQWSVQKDHSVVSVGYADGTLALFNVNTESPILRTVKDGVIVISPYYDSKISSSTVTGVQVYPSSTHPEEVSVGVCSVRSGDLALRAGTDAAPVITRRFRASGVPFIPYSPALHLPINDNTVAGLETAWLQTVENESHGVTGEMPTSACIFSRRIAIATSTAQLLLLRNVHPQTENIKRHMLATFELVPLKDKDKAKGKLCKESNTYEDAVEKYGVLWSSHFKWKDTPPADQYPLSSITAVAFCPCSNHFNRLVFGGLNGVVHVITI